MNKLKRRRMKAQGLNCEEPLLGFRGLLGGTWCGRSGSTSHIP